MTGCHEKYWGGLAVLFAGDFTQLDPPGKGNKSIYKLKDIYQFHGCINTFLELTTSWRFKNDKQWQQMLSRMRDEGLTEDDETLINKHILSSEGSFGVPLSDNCVLVLCYQ